MSNTRRLPTLALLTLMAASACGQKGPLFLPGDTNQIKPTPADDAQREDEDDEEAPR